MACSSSSRRLPTTSSSRLLLSLFRPASQLESGPILHSKRHFHSSKWHSDSSSQESFHSDQTQDSAPVEQTSRHRQTSPLISKSKKEKKLFSDLPTRAVGDDGIELKPLEKYTQEFKGNSRRKRASSIKSSDQLSESSTPSNDDPIVTSTSTSKSRRWRKLSSLASELGPTGQSWPPLAQQVLANLQAFPNCILLTRVGGFYESYFDQSSLISNLLGIKLANRSWGGRNVGMAGFPLQQLEKYLKILVQENGKLVAICEEFKEFDSLSNSRRNDEEGEEDGSSKSTKVKKKKSSQLNESHTIKRRVTRVVSPGTFIDEKFLDPFRNNYILAVSAVPKSSSTTNATSALEASTSTSTSTPYDYGLAWLDLSTADFTTTVCHDPESLRDEIARIAPREIILQSGIFDLGNKRGNSRLDPDSEDLEEDAIEDEEEEQEFERSDHPIWEVIDPGNVMISLSDPASPNAEGNSEPRDESSKADDRDGTPYKIEGLDIPSYTLPESKAVSQLTRYLKTRLLELASPESGMEMQLLASGSPMRRMREENMLIDAHTLSSLEIREAFRDGNVSHRGSLSSVMRGTVTRGGTRLLGEWLTSPSTSLSVIQFRHSLVSLFLSRAFLREDLRSTLRRGAGDISRVLQRITTRRNDEQDLLEIRDFIHTCRDIVIKLKEELKEIDEEISEINWETEQNENPIPNSNSIQLAERIKEERNQTKASLETIVESFKDLSSLGKELGEAIDERVMEHRIRHQEAMARQMEEQVASSIDSSVIVGRSVDLGLESNGHLGTLREPGIGSETNETGTKKKRKNAVVEERPDLWGPDFEHLIRPSTSKVLQSLTDEHTRLRREARILEDDLRLRFGSDKVTLKHLLGQGYIVHLQDFRSRSSKESGSSISSIEHDLSLSLGYRGRTTRTYYYDIWTSLGSKISRLVDEIKNKESLELERLRMLSLTSVPQLRKNSRLIDQLDVLLGFSQLASEFNLVKPEMTNDLTFDIKGGRHLSVELGLLEHGRMFHRNDCLLDHDRSRIQLITGPNMGGKSTFLRQNALIAILAQSGSFVPAEEARIGIVDRVFSRVGAKDDLFRDRSTFMVEMQETGQILRRATSRSLVICDEIGRGTTSSVGLSIAFATLYELHETNKCRSLFATHFHELADMLGWREDQSSSMNKTEQSFAGVDFFCTDVDESTPDTITYSHSLRRGVNRESHGLKVAKLAEMPPRAVEVAEKTLEWLSSRGKRGEDPARKASDFTGEELEKLKENLKEKN